MRRGKRKLLQNPKRKFTRLSANPEIRRREKRKRLPLRIHCLAERVMHREKKKKPLRYSDLWVSLPENPKISTENERG